MNPSPTGSFLRFAFGFLLFISLSFGITYAVNVYTSQQDGAHQTAAAIKAMLKPAQK